MPATLLNEVEFSTPLEKSPLREVPHFRDGYEFGVFLVDLLKPYDPHQISYNPGLWSWLAALLLRATRARRRRREAGAASALCLRLERELTLLSSSGERALEFGRAHGAEARYLLAPIRVDDPAPLSRQSSLLDQLAARQFVISSPTLIAAARRLFTDPRTGRQRRGAGSKGKAPPDALR